MLIADYQYGEKDEFGRNKEDNHWKLSSNNAQPLVTFQHANLKLVSIKLKTLATGNDPEDNKNDPAFHAIDTVICEYKDEANLNRPDSLFLTAQSFGQLQIVNYISVGGKIEDFYAWQSDADAPVRNQYSCTGNDLDNGLCGKFTFEKKVDTNGFWNDAWYWCWPGWADCKGDQGYIARVHKLDNTAMRWVLQRSSTRMCTVDYRTFPCAPAPKNEPKCKDLLCTEEIKTMNNIVGNYGTHVGMAQYLKMCWSGLKWKNKAWDAGAYEKTTNGCSGEPTGTWPDYTHFGIDAPPA